MHLQEVFDTMTNIEKVKKKSVKKKDPLTYEEALQKIYEANRTIQEIGIFDFSHINYWRNGTSLEVGGEFLEKLKVYPLKGEKVNSLKNIKQWIRNTKINSYVSLGVGTGVFAITGSLIHLVAGVGFEYIYLTSFPLVLGGMVFSYYNGRLCDGITDNIFQRAIIKLFFSKKSKKKLENNREKFIKYKELEEPQKIFVELTRKELEKENVFNIINETAEENGGYVVLTEDGHFHRVSREKYEELNPQIPLEEQALKSSKLMKQIEIKMKAFNESETN